jgi:hypothetical protein
MRTITARSPSGQLEGFVAFDIKETLRIKNELIRDGYKEILVKMA